MTVVAGGERIDAGGRTFEIAYTPGHASHHVSYFDRSSGVAFVGDTGGVCIDGGYILPPTPPPDIDIEAWRDSVARIEAWSPATIFMTHFGPVNSPQLPSADADAEPRHDVGLVRARLSEPGTDEEQSRRFADDLQRELRRHMTEAQLASYRAAAPPELVWLGLARYWRKRQPVGLVGLRLPSVGSPGYRALVGDGERGALPRRGRRAGVGSIRRRSAYPCGVPVADLYGPTR